MTQAADRDQAQLQARERLGRLLSYLEQDPGNAALLRDTAEAALDANDPAEAARLYSRLKDAGELSDADSNLWAIAAMRSGQPALAAETFAGLLAGRPDDPALRFNLAWAQALCGDDEAARATLDAGTAAEALPQAALLDVQLLHRAGEFEVAAERAKAHLQRHGDYPPLLAAVSTLAMDVEDVRLARACAERAGEHPEALGTLAMLALGEQQPERAKAMFERSLALDDRAPRVWIGLGLAELAQGEIAAAAGHLDHGAELFGDHLGSWIAAGWAHLLAGDRAAARIRFERAVALDGSFAEAQGSLAVIELLEGERDAAERRIEVAARLGRQSFALAFARMLLSSAAGDTQAAQRIAEAALRQPVGPDGQTIAQILARMAR